MAKARLRWLAGAGVAVVVAGAVVPFVAGGSAGAGSRSAPSITVDRGGLVQVQEAPTATTFVSKGLDTAGYLVNGTTVITSFDGTVTVPTVTCPTTGTFGADTSVQVDGATGGGISGGSFITFSCSAGAAFYSASLDFEGVAGKTFAVAPGNKVATKITLVTSGGVLTATGKVVNLTTKTTTKLTATGSGSDKTGWDIIQTFEAVTPFGKLPWAGAMVNGGTLTAMTPSAFEIINNATDGLLVTTSAINAAGTGFTTVRH